MESIHSFSSLDGKISSKKNRLIIVGQRDQPADDSKNNNRSRRRSQFQLLDTGPFASNKWTTSRYTIWNFLPKNLFEQFRRVANFYFLITAILQIIIPFSPVGPTTSLLPLLFVVSTTAIKQAYEDYLKHKLDKEINNRLYHVVSHNKLIKVRSKDIRVGDIVCVKNEEEIPCDMILLATSGAGDRCHITTANLDGETSLKSRSCFSIRNRIGDIEKINKTSLMVECEQPNATLYEFNGRIRCSKDSHIDIPLNVNNLLLRASRLRNTSNIYGLVVYTGPDTKLAHNSQVKPNKFSSTEARVNMFLIIAFVLLLLLSLLGALLYKRPNYWFLEGLKRTDSFIEIFIAHFLLYNYLVPISLYVTLEFVKFFGTVSVVEDNKLKATVWRSINSTIESSDLSRQQQSDLIPVKVAPNQHQETLKSMPSLRKVKIVEGPQCNSSDLNEDLGQVEVLFSDKTGTLTENKMRFMACSIDGQLYRSIRNQLYHEPAGLCNIPIPDVASKLATIGSNRYAALATSSSLSSFKSKISSRSMNKLNPSQRPFDHRYVPPIKEMKLIDQLENNEKVVEFFMCLCLCSTTTLNENVPLADCLPDKMDYDYQSASPDEESLISAANLYGISVCKCDERECFIAIQRNSVENNHKKKSKTASNHSPKQTNKGSFKAIVETKNSTEKYIVRHFERLSVFEFNSVRKRMSVIYNDCDNNCIVMVTKGSESVVDCIKLTKDDEHPVNLILAHFEAFAKSGLRTMLVGKKLVTQQEYDDLMSEIKNARLSTQNRSQKIDALNKRFETNLTLIGTTAVEDTLQQGVPETIANLKEAGIKVWLLTGDKVETATSVAYLCKLLDRDMELLYLIRQRDAKTCLELLISFCQRLKSLDEQDNIDSSNKRAHSEHKSVATNGCKLIKHNKFNDQVDGHRFALVSDGRSLHYAMNYAKSELSFVCKQCICVLGCRLSPLQKAEVVDMIKKGHERPITAAIGDGANDVSMIQEAHVGVGISGKEGRQAVNASDFAVNRFHMLNRLFFVHGHLFYHRTANTIHYFFYKNALFILPQFFYSFFNLSSATSLYHPIMLITFNLVYTSLPILLYGLSEVHISEYLLEHYPRLYRINTRNSQMHIKIFLSWIFVGALQASIAFYFLIINWGSHTPFLESGKVADTVGLKTMLFFVIVITATLKLYFLARYHSLSFNLTAILSVSMLPGCLYLFSLVDTSRLLGDNSFYHQCSLLLKSPMFWLAIISTTVATIIPDIILYVRGQIVYYATLHSIVKRDVIKK